MQYVTFRRKIFQYVPVLLQGLFNLELNAVGLYTALFHVREPAHEK